MSHSQIHTIYSVIRMVKWLVPVGILLYLCVANFVPSGDMHVTHTIDHPSAFVSNFASKEPFTLTGSLGGDDAFQAITTSPFYFSVTTPRLFQSVTVGLLYQNPDAQEVIRLGVRQPSGSYAYADMAYYEPRLDALPPYWIPTRDGHTVLWYRDRDYQERYSSVLSQFQQQKQALTEKFGPPEALDEVGRAEYDLQIQMLTEERDAQLAPLAASAASPVNIDDFLHNLPELSSIVQYNFDLSQYHELPGYEPKQEYTTINTVLRGSHDLYTYIGGGESLYFEFAVRIANRPALAGPITLTLYSAAESQIDQVILDEQMIETAGTDELRFRIAQDELPYGLYHVAFDAGESDVFITQIVSKQHLIVFRNKLYLADNPVYAATLGDRNVRPTGVHFKAQKVSFTTEHAEGLQTFTLNGVPQQLTELNTPYVMSGLSGVPYAYLPKNDVILEGAGYFAVSQNQFFDPLYTGVIDLRDAVTLDDYDYIIARYAQAEKRGRWLYAQATVTVPLLYTNPDNNKTDFIITLPGLPEARRKLFVHGLTFEFHKDPLSFDNIVPKVMNNLRRIAQ